MRKKYLPLIVSVIVSFLFVTVYTYGATTISTNVNTGGTLTASGAATLNGNVTLGDATTDLIHSVGGFQASSTALFGDDATFYDTTTISGAKGLVLGSSGTAITGSAGMIYYDSSNKVIKLHDGSNWFTVGTTTSGLNLNGDRLQFADLNYYGTLGTTTQQGLSILTVEATSTSAIPLTLVARSAQSANIFQARNSANVNLLYINSAGALFASSTLQVTGAATAYGAVTTYGAAIFNEDGGANNFRVESDNQTNMFLVDGTNDRVGIASSSPYVALGVTGTTTASAGMVIGGSGSPLNQVLMGTCTVNPNDGTLAEGQATTTTCTATGVRTGDTIIVTPANLPAGLSLLSASSTDTSVIQVAIEATSSTSPVVTTYASWSWMSLR